MNQFRRPAAIMLSLFAVFCFAAPVHAQLTAPDYTLNAGDELEITIWKEPDLSKKVIVRPDGKFSFPLAGDIVAQGRSVMQVQTEITNKMKTYIPEVFVSIGVTGLEGSRIYVIGQVNKPGSFVMNPRVNVLQALSTAGGLTPYAAVNDIVVLRGGAGKQRTLPFKYGDVSRGRSLEQNVALEAGDVVVVP